MALRLRQAGHTVTAYNRSPEKTRKAEGLGINGAYTLGDLASALPDPKVVWLMVPAGAAVDSTIASLIKSLKPGDIIIDGGNSLYKDSVRRHGELSASGINFIDAGVRTRAFDVPHLRNLTEGAPYLHNGGANTLEEVWTRFNITNRHGVSSDLTREQFNDLMAYLRAL